MARIRADLHPTCQSCGDRMRPVYYTPLETPVKQRAKGLWFCPRCDRISNERQSGTIISPSR